MSFAIVIAFIGIITLVILHELGHFLVAKKFGVKVEEFGIGYPPKLFGKKIGETIYSINLLPFGAFVRLLGEIGKNKDPRSFAQQSVGRRILIALGGVVAFWMIATILFSFVFYLGAPVAVEDGDVSNLIDSKIQITHIAAESPAQNSGLEAGDVIKKMSAADGQLVPSTIKEVQGFIDAHLGEEIVLGIERNKEILDVSLSPRVSPPGGEGPMGIGLVRTAIKKYAWYLAPWQGILTTANLTLSVVQGYGRAIDNAVRGVPTGVQMVGPIGVFQMLSQAQQMGIIYFINFLGLLSVYLAIFNILPIPAVDGGKILFLTIEAIRKKPIPEKLEYNITAAFFILLIVLMLWVTINDVSRLF